jgi:hypothetical protein
VHPVAAVLLRLLRCGQDWSRYLSADDRLPSGRRVVLVRRTVLHASLPREWARRGIASVRRCAALQRRRGPVLLEYRVLRRRMHRGSLRPIGIDRATRSTGTSSSCVGSARGRRVRRWPRLLRRRVRGHAMRASRGLSRRRRGVRVGLRLLLGPLPERCRRGRTLRVARHVQNQRRDALHASDRRGVRRQCRLLLAPL